MSSIARLETTYAYNKQKVVLDVSDLMDTEGYYEAIAMSPDAVSAQLLHPHLTAWRVICQGGTPK